MIEISEDKVQTLSENIGKMLKYGGKAMQCIEEMQNDPSEQMGERRYYPEDEPYYREQGGFRDGGYHHMGMRRGVAGTGRYGRY